MGRSLWIKGQPGLKSEIPDSEGCYTEKSCLTQKKEKAKHTNQSLLHAEFFISEVGALKKNHVFTFQMHICYVNCEWI